MKILKILLIVGTMAVVSSYGQVQPAREIFLAQPADATLLRDSRGGSALARNDVVLLGETTSNTATHVTTGDNTIGGGAFSNMTGMPLVIQNSGANVLIQNSTVLNLRVN